MGSKSKNAFAKPNRKSKNKKAQSGHPFGHIPLFENAGKIEKSPLRGGPR